MTPLSQRAYVVMAILFLGAISESVGFMTPQALGWMPIGITARAHTPSMRKTTSTSVVLGAKMQATNTNGLIPTVLASSAALFTSLPAGAEVLAAGMDPDTKEVLVFLAKTLIAWGVPVVSVGIVAFMVLSASRGRETSTEEDEGARGGGLMSLFGGKKTVGEPVEFLKVERLNEKLDSFKYSMTKAEQGRKAALASKRQADFERAYGVAIGDLPQEKMSKLLKAHQQYMQFDERAENRVDQLTRDLRSLAAKKANSTDGGMMSKMMGQDETKAVEEKLEKAITLSIKNELQYIAKVSEVLSEGERAKFVQMLKTRKGPGGWGSISPLSASPDSASFSSPETKPHVFVVEFPGDVTASQVAMLREEITAIVGWANASRGDSVLMILNSGGGTVTGYGLAAAQLQRIKAAGMSLTVCVEQVAASGGYMMACVGDEICASPFAVLGSIGVITEIPNVYERLKKEGIEFNTITAGKFKRTLTPTKQATKEDIAKTKADIEQILTLFKEFVASNRPSLDIDKVATGETWFGPDALKINLVDQLITADDKLLQLRKEGRELLSVKYRDPTRRGGPLALLPAGQNAFGGGDLGDIMSGLIAVARLARNQGSIKGMQGLPGRNNYEQFMTMDNASDEYMAMDERDYNDIRF